MGAGFDAEAARVSAPAALGSAVWDDAGVMRARAVGEGMGSRMFRGEMKLGNTLIAHKATL